MKFIKLCCKYSLVVLSTLMICNIPTIASTVTKNIDISYKDIKLVIDGKLITPRDSNGREIEPFVYNGTTYLPLRACSDALTNGTKSVTWDENNSTIYIGNSSSNNNIVKMSTLKPISGRQFEELSFRHNDTKIVSDSARSKESIFYGDSVGMYLLGGKYKTFNAKFACKDDFSDGLSATVQFKNVDTGEIIAQYTTYNHDEPIDISLDVSNVDKLEIIIYEDSFYLGYVYDATLELKI